MSKHVIGLDEVGWGCVAGPLTVCAVSIPEEHWDTLRAWGFRDSKKVGNRLRTNKSTRTEYSTGKCTQLAKKLDEVEPAIATWCIAEMSPLDIDDLSPADAKNHIFRTVIMILICKNNWHLEDVEVIIDGNNKIPGLPDDIKQTAIPKADDTILPCSVASVLAKAYRDHQMDMLDPLYPLYGFKDNKGYPTNQHLKALLKTGPVLGLHRLCYLQTWVTNYLKRNKLHGPQWVKALGWVT